MNDHHTAEMTRHYDEEAEATGWYGPEILFGLAYTGLKPGQALLDIGIGTGLASVLFQKAGLRVHGMDLNPRMLEACQQKGLDDLVEHDLTVFPYPFESASMDWVICTGVLNFFKDHQLIYAEVARILKPGGVFGLIVGDQEDQQIKTVHVGAEHTGSEHETLTMYRHPRNVIIDWLKTASLTVSRDLCFTIYMDAERQHPHNARAYLARRT